MNNRKYNEKKVKVIAMTITTAILLSACSIDMEKVKEATIDLGQDLQSAFTEDDTTTAEVVETEPTVEEIVVETEVLAETTPVKEIVTPEPTEEPKEEPTPTPTEEPTPEPTLSPERVDFSELTEDQLTDDITLYTEAFEEHYAIAEDTRIADFSGNRLLLKSEKEIVSVTALNLYLDGFYCEAEGLYFRYRNEALAETGILTGMIPGEIIDEEADDEELPEDIDTEEFEIDDEDIYHVVINYEYHVTNRLFTVNMSYEVTKGEEVITSSEEILIVDIYTGQTVTNDMLFKNTDEFMSFVNEQILEESEVKKAKESDIHDVTMIFDSDSKDTYVIVSAYVKDEEVNLEINIEDFEDLLTRFGRLVLIW